MIRFQEETPEYELPRVHSGNDGIGLETAGTFHWLNPEDAERLGRELTSAAFDGYRRRLERE